MQLLLFINFTEVYFHSQVLYNLHFEKILRTYLNLKEKKLIRCILHNLGLVEGQISCKFLGNTSLIEQQNHLFEHENSNCYIFATVPRS